ncbi:hypothetical protein PG996_015606 [Apiospora saccharicola]|uniref:Cytochrome P450 n=1 Tax=Apiospora saccharicola TaxID=335842 RepID=A0ABR1TMB8_9PEZI
MHSMRSMELSTHTISTTQRSFLAVGLVLLCWRLWRFTLLPRTKPLEPKELPYWIPYLGHVRSFFKDFNGALEKGRKYFGDSKEPYSVWIAGTRIYICTSPDDVADLYRNTTTISMHTVIEDMYRWIGVSDSGFRAMFAIDASAQHNIGLRTPEAPAVMINEYHRQQTKQGELFDDLLHTRIIPEFEKELRCIIDGSSPSIVSRSSNGVVVSLLQLCTSAFQSSTTTAFLGRKIWEVNPNLLQSFMVWERTNWKYLFQMPALMSQDMLKARDDIINSFVSYLEIPETERDDRNFFVKSIETMMRDVGCNEKDMAKVLMLHFWAIQGNIYKVAFWTLAHLVHNPSVLEQVQAEVSHGIKGDGQLDEIYLAEKCPLLDSLLSEVLRLTIASALIRDIVAPTHIGGKILQPGNKVLVPYHQLHLNRSVWGEEPLSFEPARFVENPKLLSSKAYRPFGGGKTLCPGRIFAKRFVGYAVAAILTKFDVCIDAEETRKLTDGRGGKGGGLESLPFPRINHTKPSPGASLPVEGDDVLVVLREKHRPVDKNLGELHA